MKINFVISFLACGCVCIGPAADRAPAKMLSGCAAQGIVRDFEITGPSEAGKDNHQEAGLAGVATFMMFSGYHLEPYSEDYVVNGLSELARSAVSGIVYATIGSTDAFLAKRNAGVTQRDVNERIFRAANAYGTSLWLQLRLYDNVLSVDGAPARNYTAEDILADAEVRQAFDESLGEAVRQYAESFQASCRIIVFEEAGIYHAPQGGGTFWSSVPDRSTRHDDRLDELFAARMTRLYAHVFARIKAIDGRCSVGMHLGHSVFDNQLVLRAAMVALREQKAAPDFILYDLYLKAQPDFDSYASRMQTRVALAKNLGIPMFHMAQLHTMNAFQHGLGRTPSKAEINAMVTLDKQLGVAGIGFYTKNATKTANFDEKPFDPNQTAQRSAFESSKDRWEYGLNLLMAARDATRLRDLSIVVSREDSQPLPPQRLWVRPARAGGWVLIGEVGPSSSSAGYRVFRHFSRSMLPSDRISVCIEAVHGTVPPTETISIVGAGERPESFLSDAELAAKAVTRRRDVLGAVTIGTKP